MNAVMNQGYHYGENNVQISKFHSTINSQESHNDKFTSAFFLLLQNNVAGTEWINKYIKMTKQLDDECECIVVDIVDGHTQFSRCNKRIRFIITKIH